MGGARHLKPRDKKKRKEMTREWKLRVQSKLEENEEAGIDPRNVPELVKRMGKKPGYKAGLYRALDPDGDQVSSGDVDLICEILKISPPLIKDEDDEDLKQDLEVIRSMPREVRKDLMLLARRMMK